MNLLSVNDVIEIKPGHKVGAEVPAHLAYENRKGDFSLRHALVTVEGDFAYLAGKYFVYRTAEDGAGSAHGVHDAYPSGHHVWCVSVGDPECRIDFYQTGCFVNRIEDITPVGVCTATGRYEKRIETPSPRLLTDEELEMLNPGIQSTVQTLRQWGFDTRDSGDGNTAQYPCDLPIPYVHILTDHQHLAEETDRLVGLLTDCGIVFSDCPHPQIDPEGTAKHPSVEASYLPLQGGIATIHVFNIILPQP